MADCGRCNGCGLPSNARLDAAACSVKKVRQVTYGLGHAKSGVSPKTRTFSLMFVQPDLEHQVCLATKINLTTSQFNSSQNFAKSTCRLELEECPETVTMGGILVFVSFGF